MPGRADVVAPARSVSATATHRVPHVLVLAWEYPGVNSRRGAALSRRIGQIVRGFADAQWAVTIVHRLNTEDDPARAAPVRELTPDGNPYTRHAIAGPSPDTSSGWWRTPVRKAVTAWTSFRHGDRSTSWAREAFSYLRSADIPQPDVIIGCFTPRGPLALAAQASREWSVPWIADLQDPWSEGAGAALRPALALWTRRILRSASLVIQVSPEWAAETARIAGRDVRVVRHAVRTLGTDDRPSATEPRSRPFTVLYAGSLNEQQQDVSPFLEAIARLRQRGAERDVVVEIAGSEHVWRKFNQRAVHRGVSDALRWLGWLDTRSLAQHATAADCNLVLPSVLRDRRGVPSKLFDYLAYGRPVLVAGGDSGGFDTLLAEWEHPYVVARSAEEIEHALGRAMHGDNGALLTIGACRRPPATELDLARQFTEWAEQLREEGTVNVDVANRADSA